MFGFVNSVNNLVRSVKELVDGVKELTKENKEHAKQQIGVTKTTLAELRVISEKLTEQQAEVKVISEKLAEKQGTDVVNLFNSTSIDPKDQNGQETGSSEDVNSSDQSLYELNRTILQINQSLATNMQSKVNIKRDYKLTSKSNFEIWMDHLSSELASNDLKEIIEKPEKFKNDKSEKTRKMKILVRDIIISHLNEQYHKRVLSLNEPSDILKKIREIRKTEANMTDTYVREKLYTVKREKKEKIHDFNERFDSIVTQYENCNPISKLTQEEIRSAYYKAVKDSCSELRSANLLRNQSESPMTMEEMRNCLLQVEAENSQDTETKANVARGLPRNTYTKDITNASIKCHRCNQFGHYKNDCHLEKSACGIAMYAWILRNIRAMTARTKPKDLNQIKTKKK